MPDSSSASPSPSQPTWLLDVLRCPITYEPLETCRPQTMELLRKLAAKQQLVNRAGAVHIEPFDDGLVNQSQTWFFPMQSGIPSLLPGEAIALEQLNAEPTD